MAQPLIETFTPDDLVAGSYPIATQVETFASGEEIRRGTVLGRVSASGKIKISKAAATDGSETPMAIAVHDVDTSSGDADGETYRAGDFRLDRLILGAGHSETTLRAAFDGTPIILVESR